MHRKSSRTPVLSPVAAIVLALLLSLPAAAQAQGSAGLSCGPEDPQQPGGSGGRVSCPRAAMLGGHAASKCSREHLQRYRRREIQVYIE